jgi:hypothetical protein
MISSAGAESPSGNAVGRIVELVPPFTTDVTIKRGADVFPAKRNTQLYNNDEISVGPGSRATIEFAGRINGAIVLDASSTPFQVHRPEQSWAAGKFQQFMALCPALFKSNPESAESTMATGAGLALESTDLRPSKTLPLVEQQVAGSSASGELAVVWHGPPSDVLLADAAGTVVAQAQAKDAGFAALPWQGIPPGHYTIQIGPTAGGLVLPVQVSSGPLHPRAVRLDDQLVSTAQALNGAEGGRLQALLELGDLAQQSYFAHALLQSIIDGESE